jgi:hypothetical protein
MDILRKIYTVIVNHSLTMITTCIKVVNLNCAATSVILALNEQILCNWCTMLMCMLMPRVQLDKGPYGICNLFATKSQLNWLILQLSYN